MTASGHLPALEPRAFLVAALSGTGESWPAEWAGADAEARLLDAVRYHGVSGLLAARAAMHGWPEAVARAVNEEARQLAMWDLRHRSLLCELLAELAGRGIRAVLMKGGALAYDLYDSPAARPRGDTDLLVSSADLGAARSVFAALGYTRHDSGEGLGDDLASQESWICHCADSSRHEVDLHWQVLNAPALAPVFNVDDCLAAAAAMPRLCSAALAMDRVRMLLHACIHRAMHRTAPYFVGGRAYVGGDRLIWSNDIHLLAGALSGADWDAFTGMAAETGMAAHCRDGLAVAGQDFGTNVPDDVLAALRDSSAARRPSYLQRSTVGKLWLDWKAVGRAGARLRFVRARLLPTTGFMRAKYPDMASAPLPMLYARRIADALRK